MLFDRSWYNRAGVEKVMGFCTPKEYDRFLQQTPIFEQMLIDDGIMLRKYWFRSPIASSCAASGLGIAIPYAAGS